MNTPAGQGDTTGLSAVRTRAAEVVGKKAVIRLRQSRGADTSLPIERMIETQAQKEYAILVERLRVPPEEREALYQLLSQTNVTRTVFIGLDPEERLLLGLPERYSTSVEDALGELRLRLGPEGFRAFEQHRETIPARRLFESLEKEMNEAGAPLPGFQREALVQAFSPIARESYPSLAASDADKAAFFERRAQQYDALVAANSAGLDQTRRTVLENILQRKLEADIRRYQKEALKRSVTGKERAP